MSKFALVYQAGIANVFEVGELSVSAGARVTTKRIMQHAFGPCEQFCMGLQHCGAEVAVYSCNRAGDIANEVWHRGLCECPFADKANPSRLFLFAGDNWS